MANEQFPHIILKEKPSTENFTSTRSGGPKNHIPKRERDFHSQHLIDKLKKAWEESENEQAVAVVERQGVYLEFKGDPGFDLVTKSLEDMRSRELQVRLLNIRAMTEVLEDEETDQKQEKTTTYATVFVPHQKKNHFLNKIQAYAEENTETGKPKNANLVNSIADIRKALRVKSFWTDSSELIPEEKPQWCEVWLSSDKEEAITRFEDVLEKVQVEAAMGLVKFPERCVKVILANRHQLEQLTTLSDDIAEYRRAKETAAFWTDMENQEQAQWVQDLLNRIHIEQRLPVAICILDTGVNNGHPLLTPVLEDEDCQSVDPNWGDHDHNGHGTLMAGLAAFSDLRDALGKTEDVSIRHCLESVKILPLPPDENKPELWGYITSQGVSRADIQAPERKRILCMPVTATDTMDRGRPSSWSGELDQLTSGAADDQKRLFIQSTGNLSDLNLVTDYTNAQVNDSVHDPGQAWNVLTVGAHTALDEINDPTLDGYAPIAPEKGLSPFATTSSMWEENKWPMKPEIVMEGGNMARDDSGFATECDDLSLLSTNWEYTKNFFSPFNMTSAATAQAAWFAAQILCEYPDIWPETIRALIVHSAAWSETLKSQFLPDNPTKTDYARMLRICGYGIPDLERALYSASNSLTLISQADIQPFDKKEGGGGYRTKDMHFYDLPWPKEILENLPDQTHVEMRVTLSYFIEPGPGEIGWKDRYRYSSHGLRFDVKPPGVTKEDFMKQINKDIREDGEKAPGTASASEHWVIGPNGRNKGSIHSDIWQGTAAELAGSGFIVVYPVIGWWRERAYLNKWNRATRYSLIISINTPETSVDIYTPVAAKVGIPVPIPVGT